MNDTNFFLKLFVALIAAICLLNLIVLDRHYLTQLHEHDPRPLPKPSKQDFGKTVESTNDTRDGHSNNKPAERSDGIHNANANANGYGKNNGNNKPKFILHVGPPKTGTTSIQCGLGQLSGDLASLDNYYFVGTPCPGKEVEQEIEEQTGHKPIKPLTMMYGSLLAAKELQPEVQEFFDHHYELQHNIILSVEKFSSISDGPKVMDNFARVFDVTKWDVRIVITYRRYLEWIPSSYFQRTLGGREKGDDHWMSFREYFLKRHNHWEDSGLALTFHDELQFLESDIEQHPTIKSLHKFESRFQTTIFNYHMKGDLVTNFVCHALPDANHVCQKLRINPANIHERRQSTQRGFLIAKEAYTRGILDDETYKDKKRLWTRIMRSEYARLKKTENHADTDPQQCLTENELDYLQTVSLASEQYLSASRHDLIWGDEDTLSSKIGWKILLQRFQSHASNFHTYKQEEKFCFLDVEKIFESPVWIDLFRTLRDNSEEYLTKRFMPRGRNMGREERIEEEDETSMF